MTNRKATTLKVLQEVVETAVEMGLIKEPQLYRERLSVTVHHDTGCRGGVQHKVEGGAYMTRPAITLSTHDRYHSPISYLREAIQPNAQYRRSNWDRVATLMSQGQYYFCEYASIDKDPEIGGFIIEDESHVLLCIVCHEVAHTIQYWNHYLSASYMKRMKPHGDEWRTVYRALRNHLLNPLLGRPEQPAQRLRLAANTKPVTKRPKAGTKRERVWLIVEEQPHLTCDEVVTVAVKEYGVSPSVARKMYAACKETQQ